MLSSEIRMRRFLFVHLKLWLLSEKSLSVFAKISLALEDYATKFSAFNRISTTAGDCPLILKLVQRTKQVTCHTDQNSNHVVHTNSPIIDSQNYRLSIPRIYDDIQNFITTLTFGSYQVTVKLGNDQKHVEIQNQENQLKIIDVIK